MQKNLYIQKMLDFDLLHKNIGNVHYGLTKRPLKALKGISF